MSNAAATSVRPKSMLALSNAGRPEGAGEGGGHASTKPESGHQLEGSGPEAALEVVPHQGLVAIDMPAGEARQYLVHCVTLERVPLDLGGEWFIKTTAGGRPSRMPTTIATRSWCRTCWRGCFASKPPTASSSSDSTNSSAVYKCGR